MIITCPACAKRYLVEETAIDEAGRQVQCIACQHEWFFKPANETPKHNQVHLDLIGMKSSVARQGVNLNFTWVLMLSTLIVCFIGIYFARHSIAFHFPQSAKLFQIIGLPVELKPTQISLENVKPYFETVAQGERLIITGVLINNSKQVQNIPILKITAKGDCAQASLAERTIVKAINKGGGVCTIAQWSYTPPTTRLLPGEKLDFEIHSDRPLEGAQTINVKF